MLYKFIGMIFRRHHSNKMGVEYQGLLSPEETDSLLMERATEVKI